ncbi:hypothetical protein D1872_340960 [compost metagenome]
MLAHLHSTTTAAYKGGGCVNKGVEIDRLPLLRAVYFLLWKESINTTKVANETISVNA